MKHATLICNQIELTGEDVPGWIHIMQAGTFVLNDGRGPYTLADPERVIQASRRAKVDLYIDRDHETQFAPKGSHIKAAGWIKEMEAREDGIWARIEWTATAREQIMAREYRYISPVFIYHLDTTNILRITHASLTNDPAMELTAVASNNRNHNQKEKTEMLKDKLIELLGLPKDASDEAVATAASEKLAENDLSELQTALDKKGGSVSELAAAASSLREKVNTSKAEDPDPSKFVPIAAHKEVVDRVAVLEEKSRTEKAEQAVASAIKDGKIAPGQRKWAMQYASSNIDEFNKYVEATPKIFGTESAASKQPGETDSGLSVEQRAVCSQLGISEDVFKPAEKADQ